ncbi:GNAT superfamily N-acetyltransferase [Rhizobium sp. SG_E_25_P2]|nr:GNAT superfamily N-acetyltransferase [Rhizobium sp. SG_E_25_P2]
MNKATLWRKLALLKGLSDMVEEFSALPLTGANFPDWETVMGAQGGCYGCWCTYFRLKSEARDAMSRDDRKHYMHDIVQNGAAPGIIGYLNGVAVGWVQVGPRMDVPRWNGVRTVSHPVDQADAQDENVWAVSCFFVVRSQRGKGLSHRLLGAAVEFARQRQARVLDACPIDKAKQSASVGLFVGPSRIFHAAGFQEIALRKAGRPLMRLTL